ncbi:Uu.00g106730.m01.CDS01 [Anthostomella pinea]|uniref:Uu.00g106730.m01.CDS01 n=1 Tax=Anthostomella pinea TaxID=933095 RepID=A0AAI8VEW5_9PEZI|nr:Uu.00g106730.m01.CDS01 [Anthostomella pinea]
MAATMSSSLGARLGWPSAEASSSQVPSASNSDKGNGNSMAAPKPWADEPWPLIETPSNTQVITHQAIHIASEVANLHNTMIRALNAIYLQAPHVCLPADVADLLFLTQSWSRWVLDHHKLKETTMLPGFESALSLPPGALRSGRRDSGKATGQGDQDAEASEAELEELLQHVHVYAVETHADPASYSSNVLQNRLSVLARVLVPHLTRQVRLMASMRELCASAVVTRTRPPSFLPPFEGSSSTAYPRSSTSSAPSPLTLPTPGLSAPASSASSVRTGRVSQQFRPKKPPYDPALALACPATAEARAARLMSVFGSADWQASNTMDRFVVPPMVVRLRDATFEGGGRGLFSTVDYYRGSESRNQSSVNVNVSDAGASAALDLGMAPGGAGFGFRSSDVWPRMSVLTVHAIADKLSPRHAGAWRFLPCDVWGKPRELAFLE